MDILRLLEKMARDGALANIATNPLAQFGTAARPLLGAQLLPERILQSNSFREEGVKFRTYAAVPSTRYSPVTLFDGALTSSFLVELGESDFGTTLDANTYDALRAELATGSMEQAAARLMEFLDQGNNALLQRNEIWRWQAIVKSQIDAKHGNVQFTVPFANPAGHRVTVASGTTGSPAGWFLSTYDPIKDILAMMQMLSDKGYQVNRAYMSSSRFQVLQRNPIARQYMNSVVAIPNAGGTGITVNNNSANLTGAQLLQILRDYSNQTIPGGLIINDQQYNTRNGTKRYMDKNAIVFVSTTGRAENYPSYTNEETEPLIVQDTLGYMGVGRAAGQDTPGRVIQMEAILNKKPPRVELEAWQTSGPVILEPEAVGVINVPDPT